MGLRTPQFGLSRLEETMKKYKIAIIHNIISPYRTPLFEELANHPSIDLFVYYCAETHREREWHILKSDKYSYNILPSLTLKFSGIISHINPSIIPKLIREKYSAIIIGGYTDFTTQAAFIISKLMKTRIILWSGSTTGEPSLLRKLSSPLAKFIARHSDACIAYGTKAGEYLVSLGVPQEGIFYAYNTVDTEFFQRENSNYKPKKKELKDRLNIKNGKVVLYVGQLIEKKGVRYLIQAFAQLKQEIDDVSLVIAGDGRLRNELISLCGTLQLPDVHFIGFIQQQQLPLYYSIADVLVLPSTEEVWGLVLNEAMSCGLPVIATDKVGASIDLIRNGVNGYVVAEGAPDQLYQALKKVLPATESMGMESQKIIEDRFTIAHAVDGFVSAINYALNRKAKRSPNRE